MKILLALVLLAFSTLASAEWCTSVIKDNFSQYEYENFTRYSYSREDACFQAMYDCRGVLMQAQSQGRYYNASCVIIGGDPMPNPPRENLICQTDLVDYWGNTVRQFSAPGASEYDACRQSDEFCKIALARGTSNGVRCVNRGIINGRYPNPYPTPTPPVIIEECHANRFDPAGVFIEAYLGRAEGPRGTDVKGAACREAMGLCTRELVGRQTCAVER